MRAIHAARPVVRIAYISIAPNPARWAQIETVKAANQAIKEWMTTDPRLTFIDVYPAMLGPDGQPKPEIFVADRLHMNAKGYAIWRAIVGPHFAMRFTGSHVPAHGSSHAHDVPRGLAARCVDDRVPSNSAVCSSLICTSCPFHSGTGP